MPVLFEFCQWLQETNISTSIRESNILFPFIEGTHLLGLGVSAGTIAMSDLRLLGVLMKKEKASKVFDALLPFTMIGFVIVFGTGSLLFLAEPAKSYGNYWFWLKLTFMALAGVNALVYHTTVHKRIAQWDSAAITPTGAKMAGVFSLVFWTMVIWLGRQFAYNH
ncbi:MAG: DUF6644 family protein [Bryobacteraceae bacterium]